MMPKRNFAILIQELQVRRSRQQLPKTAFEMSQRQCRRLLRPLNHQRRLHPRNQFPHRHVDPLPSAPAAIICLKEVEYVALRMGDQQPAFTGIPAKGDGADADDIADTTAQDIADTQVSAQTLMDVPKLAF